VSLEVVCAHFSGSMTYLIETGRWQPFVKDNGWQRIEISQCCQGYVYFLEIKVYQCYFFARYYLLSRLSFTSGAWAEN